MKKYLYGAAVQGIQQFIFQSTELAEIAEASAIVDDVCKSLFAECLYGRPVDEVQLLQDYKQQLIVNAAGNVKVILEEEDCRRVCLNFQKMVTELVPGITVSQAVVELPDSGEVDGELIDQLEHKLRVQRNQIPRNAALGLMGTLRCRKTGMPAVAWADGCAIDKATEAKQKQKRRSEGRSKDDLCEKAFGFQIKAQQYPYNIEDLEGVQKWVAIIHADGNGLGQVVRKVGHNTEDYPIFSRELDKATCNAVKETFYELCSEGKIMLEREKNGTKQLQVLPIRPVVLGGDDVTVICRADLALDFVRILCRKFQEQTQSLLGKILKENHVFDSGEDYLTLCAGVAFAKSNYPFYFAYQLAEDLCSVAKKDARNQVKDVSKCLIPACVSFHKIQDSFVENYQDIRSRELMLPGGATFENGAYYLDQTEGRDTMDELLKRVKKLMGTDRIVKNALRQWLADMAIGQKEKAQQRLNRMYEIKSGKSELIEKLTAENKRVVREHGQEREEVTYAAYDVMSLSAVYKSEKQ